MINNRYKIIKKIGEGRSKVFLCSDELIGTKIAIKVLPFEIDAAEKQTFRQEFFYLKKFNHPNIIKVLDYGNIITISDELRNNHGISLFSQFISLEYFEAETIADSFDQLNKDIIPRLIYSVASVLFHLHQANFIYYDLKPENILIKFVNNDVQIKFIDFGFTRHLLLNNTKNIMGSLKFIAPEVLNREARNHKADLYSLGVLIYRLIYNKYPIEFDEPLMIYKAQVEGKINFPRTSIFPNLIEIMKQLLDKNVGNRPTSSFEVIRELKISSSEEFKSGWNSPKVHAGRKTELEQCKAYLTNDDNQKPIKIVGPYNSGKSFLLQELHSNYDESILLTRKSFNKNLPVSNQILSQFFFNLDVSASLRDELKLRLNELIDNKSDLPIDELRSILVSILKKIKIILLIDDINTFDPVEKEIISNILPLIIVNNGKVIWTANNENADNVIKLFNVEEIELKPYSITEVNEFLDFNYAHFLPKDKIFQLVQKYSELQPGSIEKFINNLVFNKIISFDTEKGIDIRDDSSVHQILQRSLEEIYSTQYRELTDAQKLLLNYFSLFQNNYSKSHLCELLNINIGALDEILDVLEKNNVGKYNHFNNGFEFYSPGLKSFIISDMDNPESYHKNIVDWLVNAYEQKYNNDLAYHCEKAGIYQKAFEHYQLEIEKARKASANHHLINLINHVINLPLEIDQINKLKIDLTEIYFLIGDMNACYSLIEELLSDSLNEDQVKSLMILKGNTQIKLGDIQKGIDTLHFSLNMITQPHIKEEINVSIASASLYLNRFDDTINICYEIIKKDLASNTVIGKAYNLLGLVELYKSQNLTETIKNFSKSADYYLKDKDNSKLAGANLNIGNIYVMMHDYENAKKYWDEAFDINNKIGSLDQEGLLLLNYGILDYDLIDFESALKRYERAKLIFENLGEKNSAGLAYHNLAECHLKLCNFNAALENIDNAQFIFEEIKSYRELGEALFLKGNIYFKLNDHEELDQIIKSLEQLVGKKRLPEKFVLRINQLEAQYQILLNKSNDAINLLNELLNKLSESNEREDNYNFAASLFNLISIYINLNMLKNAEEVLQNKKLDKIAIHNNLISIEREFWLAKFKFISKSDDPFCIIENILKKIEEISITELTWKVLFLAGNYFEERGNKIKSEKYYSLTKAVLLNIEKSIPTKELLRKFHQMPEIVEVRKLCF